MEKEPSQSQEEILSEFRHPYEEVLLRLLQDRYERAGKPLPRIPETKLRERTPYLLEELSEAKLKEGRGKNQFIILMGPAGGGKGTIGKVLEDVRFRRLPRLLTRNPRPGEVPGKDAQFISNREFEKMLANNEIVLNSKRIHPQTGQTEHWGIAIPMIRQFIEGGGRFYFEGSTRNWEDFNLHPQIRKLHFMPILLIPPSFQEHCARFVKRQTEIAQGGGPIPDLRQGLQEAVSLLERQMRVKHDYIWIVNDEVERVCQKIVENF